METTNLETAYQTYRPEARTQARYLRPVRGAVDLLGMDQDDYRQEFQLRAANAALQYQSTYGWCTPAEKRYARAAVRNLRNNWARNYCRVAAIMEGPPLDIEMLPEEIAPTYEEEPRFEARSALKRLDENLEGPDRQLFGQLVAAGGSIEQAWADAGRPTGLHGFSQRVFRLRKKAKKLIETSRRNW